MRLVPTAFKKYRIPEKSPHILSRRQEMGLRRLRYQFHRLKHRTLNEKSCDDCEFAAHSLNKLRAHMFNNHCPESYSSSGVPRMWENSGQIVYQVVYADKASKFRLFCNIGGKMRLKIRRSSLMTKKGVQPFLINPFSKKSLTYCLWSYDTNLFTDSLCGKREKKEFLCFLSDYKVLPKNMYEKRVVT